MGFKDSIKANTDKIKEQINDNTVEMSKQLFTAIVRRTPVGLSVTRGQLKNNWYVGQGLNVINKSYSRVFNPTGAASYARINTLSTSKEFVGKDGQVSFTNIVRYGFRAEYAGWPKPNWSGRVRPYAMIRNSFTEMAAKNKK